MAGMIVPGGSHPHSQRPPSTRFGVFLRFFPSYLLAFGAYALCATAFGFDPPTSGVIFQMTLVSDANFSLRYNELFIIVTLGMLMIELIKASNSSHESTWIEHMFSTVVFIAMIVAFLVWKPAGNATFLMITCMSGIDVLAGWTISYRAALRDVSFG